MVYMTIIRDKNGRFIKGSKFWLGKKRPEMIGNTTGFKKGEKPWNWKGGDIQKTCLNCGKKYFVKRCAINRSKFCSRECRATYNSLGIKNCNWKNGITKNREHLKHSENYKKWRLKVFQRDRFTCKLCGHRSKKSKAHGDKRSDIEAHHIIPIRENPKLVLKTGNGITLCKTCHLRTYSKEEKFAKVFKEILRDYTSNIPKG